MTTADAAALWIGRVWSSAAILLVAAIVYGAIRWRIHDWRADRKRRADVTETLRLAAVWAEPGATLALLSHIDPLPDDAIERMWQPCADELARRRDGGRG
jgi:hypothetical protein